MLLIDYNSTVYTLQIISFVFCLFFHGISTWTSFYYTTGLCPSLCNLSPYPGDFCRGRSDHLGRPCGHACRDSLCLHVSSPIFRDSGLFLLTVFCRGRHVCRLCRLDLRCYLEFKVKERQGLSLSSAICSLVRSAFWTSSFHRFY